MSTRRNGRNATLPPYEEILTLAVRAPSIHNTQPWLWRLTDGGLDLMADYSRILERADPGGRNLLLSCGAVLHHLQVATSGLGWETAVRRLPDSTKPGWLASVVLRESRTPSVVGARRLHTLTVRQTDRRRFAKTPVSPRVLARLAHSGAAWGAQVLPITRRPVIDDVLRANAQADIVQRSDEAYVLELAAWTRFRRGEGVRPEVLPRRRRGLDAVATPQRFPDGLLEEAVLNNDQADASVLLLVSSSSDDTLSRLRAGEAMSEAWLQAVDAGLSVVPLSQCIEVDETRRNIVADLLADRTSPQILMQVGHLPPGRAPLPRSPRRAISDVIVRS